MPNLVGIGLSQVPTNSMLGGLAYQDPEHASIKNLDLKNISQINSEIADTAVDVFIYDTSKDSDGGAWRKRTTHTSWYNETLGTATRGTRREFPAVAVIVATAASTRRRLIIYDGDDPNLPMWMIVDSTDGQWHQTETASPVYALNGIIALGSSSGGQPLYATRNRLDLFNFISDKIEGSTSAAQYEGVIEGIVNRSDVAVVDKMYGSNPYSLVNYRINDVAMTVLPNASIDDATGLPVPTIAVATDGGTSVIKDDGTVVDFNDALGSTRPVSTVVIRGNDIVHWNINNGTMQQFFDALNATTDSTNDVKYNYTAGGGHATCENVSALLRDPGDGPYYLAVRDSKSIAAGAQSGMSVFVDGIDRTFSTNNHSIFDSRVAYITSDYNTGWMHGDIKGAFLSDTDIEDGVELVSNGTFNTNTTGWTMNGGGSATISSGQVQITNNGTTNDSLNQTVTTVVGKTYEISATITPQGGGPMPRLYVGNKYVQVGSNSNSAQTVTLTFLAYSTSTIVSINANTTVNNAVTLADNVSMKLTNDVIGTNLIANGDFSTSSTAAFTTAGGGSVTVVSGLLRLTDTSGSFCYASAPFATVIGKQYFVSVDIVNSSNTANANYIRIGHSHNGTENHDVNYGTSYGTKEIYITATATTTYLTLISGNGVGETGHWDNILIKPVQEDRSVNNKGLQVLGTVTKTPVATGAELVAYSGFTAANYLSYNASDMAFGTGDFSVSLWCIPSTDTTNEFILELDDSSQGSNRFYFLTTNTATKRLYTPWDTDIAGSDLTPGQWNHVVVGRKSGYGFLYVNNKWIADGYKAWTTALNGNGNGTISNYAGGPSNDYAWSGSLALLRISGSAPTAEQVSKMYHDEKFLFQENAKCTLYGSSDAVTALAYDEVTDQLHVGTSSGRSDFQGLRRINNTTTAVTTAISAHDEFIIEQ